MFYKYEKKKYSENPIYNIGSSKGAKTKDPKECNKVEDMKDKELS